MKAFETGAELIARERKEQINKHGYSIEHDQSYNESFEFPLTKAASALSIDDNGNRLAREAMKPKGWDGAIWLNMMDKSYKERLVIAGALIAAEIDRVTYIQEKKENTKPTD